MNHIQDTVEFSLSCIGAVVFFCFAVAGLRGRIYVGEKEANISFPPASQGFPPEAFPLRQRCLSRRNGRGSAFCQTLRLALEGLKPNCSRCGDFSGQAAKLPSCKVGVTLPSHLAFYGRRFGVPQPLGKIETALGGLIWL